MPNFDKEKYKCFIFDFDGVIKDTIDAKGEAFVSIFEELASRELQEAIQCHHKENGGVSRSYKIQTYLKWIGIDSDPSLVEEYCKKFSERVEESVVHAAFVPGILDFLRCLPAGSSKGIISATPEPELISIVSRLGLPHFDFVHGWPKVKSATIRAKMLEYGLRKSDIVFFGDAVTDIEAAICEQVDFVLIKTGGFSLSHQYPLLEVKDFNELV